MPFFSHNFIHTIAYARPSSTPDSNGDAAVSAGAAATGYVEFLDQMAIHDGDLITITDYAGVVKIFELDNDATVGPGHILVDMSGLGGSQNNLAVAFKTALNAAAFGVTAGTIDGTYTSRVHLTATQVGTAGNVAIVLTLNYPGSSVASGMSGGTQPALTTGVPARVQGVNELVRGPDDKEVLASHVIYTATEILMGDQVWCPSLGDDTSKKGDARHPLAIKNSDRLVGNGKLFTVYL